MPDRNLGYAKLCAFPYCTLNPTAGAVRPTPTRRRDSLYYYQWIPRRRAGRRFDIRPAGIGSIHGRASCASRRSIGLSRKLRLPVPQPSCVPRTAGWRLSPSEISGPIQCPPVGAGSGRGTGRPARADRLAASRIWTAFTFRSRATMCSSRLPLVTLSIM